MNVPCMAPMQWIAYVVRTRPWWNIAHGMEESPMSHAKHASKRKRQNKAVPVFGAAGLSLSLAGGASAATAPPTANLPSQHIPLSHEIILGEEEISDVSLGTFYVFDKEDAASELGSNLQLAAKGGGGGGGGGARGCGGRGCAAGGCGRGCAAGGCGRGCAAGGCGRGCGGRGCGGWGCGLGGCGCWGGCGCGCCLSWGGCGFC
jgi:hypothetical protein